MNPPSHSLCNGIVIASLCITYCIVSECTIQSITSKFWDFPVFQILLSLFCGHEWRRSRISFSLWESCDHEHVENIRDIPDPSWLPPSCCKICEIVHFQSRNISASLDCDCQSLHLCAPTLSLDLTQFLSQMFSLSFIREQMDWISLVSSSCFYQL